MNIEQLKLLIAEGEGLTVEFKEKYTPKIDRDIIRNMKRYDIYEIPLDALREAIVNAIIHRNYSMRGTSISISVFDDRVEIVNPGGLPSGVTKQNFGKESVRRNFIIADLFHRMGKVERMGGGIGRMRDLMKEAGLKGPVFEPDIFFRTIFYRHPEYSLKPAMDLSFERRVVEKGVEKLSPNQRKIFETITKDPSVSAQTLSEIVGISHRKIQTNIAKLKDRGLLQRVGPNKGGHWKILG